MGKKSGRREKEERKEIEEEREAGESRRKRRQRRKTISLHLREYWHKNMTIHFAFFRETITKPALTTGLGRKGSRSSLTRRGW